MSMWEEGVSDGLVLVMIVSCMYTQHSFPSS